MRGRPSGPPPIPGTIRADTVKLPMRLLRRATIALSALPIAALLVVVGCRPAVHPAPVPDGSRILLGDGDRILVLAPHPDDEVLGAGGVLHEAVSRKLPVHVVFLTNGDSNEWSFLAYRKRPVFMP